MLYDVVYRVGVLSDCRPGAAAAEGVCGERYYVKTNLTLGLVVTRAGRRAYGSARSQSIFSPPTNVQVRPCRVTTRDGRVFRHSHVLDGEEEESRGIDRYGIVNVESKTVRAAGTI